MLFARFLADNNLLVEPDSGVAISMAECEELARESGEDPRSMAARFAQDSLPQIFRSGDPVLEVTLAPETRQALDKLLDSLPEAAFIADDSLGWTYQYWQAEQKDAVNESGNKIGADELPAVTQLFTEHYMVLFLYHNTIGAWHAGKVLAANPSLAESAQSEEEVRYAVRLHSHGGYDFEYLRFVREPKDDDQQDAPSTPWRPAAGTFDRWPNTARELKILDPCCGSGHFLTAGLELLLRLRMDEEGLGLEDAVGGVIADNLHGLELDPRCTQIAAFNLALAAWKLARKPIDMPAMHIACSGLSVGATKEEWIGLAGESTPLRVELGQLYDIFCLAPEYGSLIDPGAVVGDLYQADVTELLPLLQQALSDKSTDAENTEIAVAASSMSRSAELLSQHYTLTITNVPYLGRGQHSAILKSFADEHYRGAKANLATMFVERMLRWLAGTGTSASVTPQSWLYQTSYKDLRKRILEGQSCNLIARLGPGAFETISGEVVNIALCIISGSQPTQQPAMAGLDASPAQSPAGKAALLRGKPVTGYEDSPDAGNIRVLSQEDQLASPDARIALSPRSSLSLTGQFARAFQGLKTGDDGRFRRCQWEVTTDDARWAYCQSTVEQTSAWGGMRYRVDAKNDGAGWARRQGMGAWGRAGVAISQMSALPVALYSGAVFDSNMTALVPVNEELQAALWCFCSDEGFTPEVRAIDLSMKVPNGSFEMIPIELDKWREIAEEKYPHGLPKPQSNDPTQWVFHGHPANAEPTAVLQVAVCRLLGHRWPPELDLGMRLADEARDWVARCDGLLSFADEDGIVCLSATRGERSAADRIRDLLSAAFGSDWSAARERELLSVAGDSKRPAENLTAWLRDNFFEEHCKLFDHRPFVWHIWDGCKSGFHCLVSGHRLSGPNGEGRRTLDTIAYSYLGDWIERQKADQRDGKEGADARLAAAQDLQAQLEKILEGEPPYDLFVRWKPLHEQAIGWEPDINDGIRLNIRPFMKGELRKGGKKGAGLLRWKPNIKWSKDRGKEPRALRPKVDFPWFWSCEDRAADFAGGRDFDGHRWNDLHYSAAIKKLALERHARAGDVEVEA